VYFKIRETDDIMLYNNIKYHYNDANLCLRERILQKGVRRNTYKMTIYYPRHEIAFISVHMNPCDCFLITMCLARVRLKTFLTTDANYTGRFD